MMPMACNICSCADSPPLHVLLILAFNPLTPVPAVIGHAKTHPQFPMPAITGHEKTCEDNCLSYSP